jgi:hypothetical protein
VLLFKQGSALIHYLVDFWLVVALAQVPEHSSQVESQLILGKQQLQYISTSLYYLEMSLLIVEEHREDVIGVHPFNEEVISEDLAVGVLVVLDDLVQVLQALDLPVQEVRPQAEQTQVQLHVLSLHLPLVLRGVPPLQVVDALDDAFESLSLDVSQDPVWDVLQLSLCQLHYLWTVLLLELSVVNEVRFADTFEQD